MPVICESLQRDQVLGITLLARLNHSLQGFLSFMQQFGLSVDYVLQPEFRPSLIEVRLQAFLHPSLRTRFPCVV